MRNSFVYSLPIWIIAGIIWAFYNFTVRTITGKYSPLTLSYYQMVFGTVFFIPLVILEHGTVREIIRRGLCFYDKLSPRVWTVFSRFLLHEAVSLRQIIGRSVVIAGVVLSTDMQTGQKGQMKDA